MGQRPPWKLSQGVGLSFPQNDPDKEYNMPKDGTVHELTSNVGAAQGHLAGPSLAQSRPCLRYW